MANRGVLVFSGYNQRAIIALIRTLEVHGVVYGIVATGDGDAIFKTRYRDYVVAVRKVRQLEAGDIKRCIAEARDTLGVQGVTIIPSTEALNRYLQENQRLFADMSCEVPLVSKGLYEQISDKYKFGELCKSSSIDIPLEYKSIKDVIFPFVAKPYTYKTSDENVYSPVIIHNTNELNDYTKKYSIDHFYFQEYVRGESFYLQYYFYRDGSVVKLSQRNYVQQPYGKSIVAATTSDIHNSPLSDKYEQLFRAVGYNGLVMVEVKVDKGRQVMIEANPRPWGPSQLMVDAKVNLFEDLLFEQGYLNSKPVHNLISARYFWGGGVGDGRELAYHGYSSKEFIEDMELWKSADVYHREDTDDLYESEMNGRCSLLSEGVL